MGGLLSLAPMHFGHEPTPIPSQEGNGQDGDEWPVPSWEGSGVGRFVESLLSLLRVHWDHEPWKAPNVGQASRLPGERASASGSVPSALPTGAGETPALRYGSWRGEPPAMGWVHGQGRRSLRTQGESHARAGQGLVCAGNSLFSGAKFPSSQHWTKLSVTDLSSSQRARMFLDSDLVI